MSSVRQKPFRNRTATSSVSCIRSMSNTSFNYTCTHGNIVDDNNPECYDAVDSTEVVTSFTLAIIGGVFVLGLFSILRNFQSWKPIYHKRATVRVVWEKLMIDSSRITVCSTNVCAKHNSTDLCILVQQISDLLFRPPPLKFGGLNKVWSFLFPVFNLSDGDLFKTGGLDSLVCAHKHCLLVFYFAMVALQQIEFDFDGYEMNNTCS